MALHVGEGRCPVAASVHGSLQKLHVSASRMGIAVTTAPAQERTATATSNVPPRERRIAIMATIVTVVLWASAFVGIRAAGRCWRPVRCRSPASSSAASCSGLSFSSGGIPSRAGVT